jgi:hypothetical protein
VTMKTIADLIATELNDRGFAQWDVWDHSESRQEFWTPGGQMPDGIQVELIYVAYHPEPHVRIDNGGTHVQVARTTPTEAAIAIVRSALDA